jgi:hypothetical protein
MTWRSNHRQERIDRRLESRSDRLRRASLAPESKEERERQAIEGLCMGAILAFEEAAKAVPAPMPPLPPSPPLPQLPHAEQETEYVFDERATVRAHEHRTMSLVPPMGADGAFRLDRIECWSPPKAQVWIVAVFAGINKIYPSCPEEKDVPLRIEDLADANVFCDLYQQEHITIGHCCALHLTFFSEQDGEVQIILRGRRQLTIGI